jgi:hypothetical protein
MKRLTENQCIEAIQKYLQDCDADELARLTGELFGGDCLVDYRTTNGVENFYEFTPNEFYSGELDDIKNE